MRVSSSLIETVFLGVSLVATSQMNEDRIYAVTRCSLLDSFRAAGVDPCGSRRGDGGPGRGLGQRETQMLLVGDCLFQASPRVDCGSSDSVGCFSFHVGLTPITDWDIAYDKLASLRDISMYAICIK